MTQPIHSDSDPVCPVHGTIMLPHKFEQWELQSVRENVNGFKCTNSSCSVVYLDDVERFFVIENGILTPFRKSGPH